MRYALPQPFRDLEHTADVGVAVEGATAEEALARLVLAQAQLLAGGGEVAAASEETFTVGGERGYGGAAVALLRELLFRFATERLLPAACEVVRLAPGEAVARVALGAWDEAGHAEGLDLKAVTRHAARFERRADGVWEAQVVFDI